MLQKAFAFPKKHLLFAVYNVLKMSVIQKANAFRISTTKKKV